MIENEDLVKRRGKVIPNKKTLSYEIKKSISMLIFTLLSIIVMTGVVFLLNTSQSSQKGYVLEQEQLKKDDLESEQNTLKNKIIGVQSYNKIESNPLIKSMIKPENILYIDKKE